MVHARQPVLEDAARKVRCFTMMAAWHLQVARQSSSYICCSDCKLLPRCLLHNDCRCEATCGLFCCRTSGGDKVEAFLCGPDDVLVPATITDLKSGSYTVDFTVTRAGAWTLKPRVQTSSPASTPQTFLHPYMHACMWCAHDCMISFTLIFLPCPHTHFLWLTSGQRLLEVAFPSILFIHRLMLRN